MAWVETLSPSFRARHDSAEGDEADRILHALELTRDRLGGVFPRMVTDLTVVLHRSTLSLSLANPLLPVRRRLTAPAARSYVAGWAGGQELHVLAPTALDARAAKVAGSREMLRLTAPALYSRRVVVENNRDLRRRIRPARATAELRWAFGPQPRSQRGCTLRVPAPPWPRRLGAAHSSTPKAHGARTWRGSPRAADQRPGSRRG
jgi:hypothetical protein